MSTRDKARVLRLRYVPGHLDRLEVIKLLSKSLKNVEEADITIFSLALDVNTLSQMPRKVATLTFQSLPATISSNLQTGDVRIEVPGLAMPLVLDSHFRGITPVNEVPERMHTHDCFVISGLGSHPFGSWQPHGADKSFMWIRDELPHLLLSTRFLIYGYDTTLLGSDSFQTISHLGISLNQELSASGYAEPSSKPIIFLAHSLGGVILKQSLIALAGGYERENAILDKVRGSIFFGVPSRGMSVPDLFTMIGSQPNTVLLDELSNQSDFLPRLDKQFRGISKLQDLHYYWAFETKVTHRVEACHDTSKFARTGTKFIMVPPESATGGLNQTKPHLTLQIDENHSDMVKFSAGDHRIRIIADKLEDIGQARGSVFRQARTMLDSQLSSSDDFLTGDFSPPEEGEPRNEFSRDQPWNHRSILLSLRAPERDLRLEQIDDRVGDTFDWAFDDDSTGLCTWLSRGSGLFWVCGKPGSGKSTFMKHLYQDTRTAELLRASSIGTKLMVVSFFFHHRGNRVQKSFEGLLRSLVSQILEQEERLIPNVYPIFEPQFPVRFESQHKNSLRNDIRKVFGEESFRTSQANSRLREIVDNQLKLTAQHRLGVHLKELLQICMGTYGEYDFDFEIQDDLWEISDPNPRFPLPKIQEVLRLHYHRVEQTKKDIINSVWTRDNLHDALRRLFSQDQFKMNILLILDALDEYGGQPEFIASILQDLDNVQAPSTRLRIIFSSRPWKVFAQEFANTPGFRIHEHTGNDIEELCATQIPQNDSALRLLSPLIPEIVARARGVFIWVKLVMSELSLMAVAGDMQMPHLQEELSRCLDSVPDELDQFYRLIVQRIPNSVRWDSYVILETISRFGELLSVDELVQIVRLSSAQNFSDAQNCFTRQQGKSTLALGSPQFLAQSKQYLETATGGLVEVVMGTSGIENPKANVQFMHQSVQDFVQSSDLKSISLGASRARLVVENGYSFLSKYLFTHPHASSKSRAANYAAFGLFARKAEHTTGYSQMKFFQPQPGKKFLPSLLEDHLGGEPLSAGFQEIYIDSIQIRSVIELAVVHGLKLCLDDALKEDPQYISRQPDRHRPDLIGLLLMCTLQSSAPHEVSGRLLAVDTAEFLLARGLNVSNNITGLGLVIKLLWVPPDDYQLTDPAELKEVRSSKIHILAETLVQAWSRVESGERQPVLLPAAPMLCSGIGEVKSCSTCRSLHLIESLLRLSINTDNSSALLRDIDHRMREDTPLDRALTWFQTEIETQQARRGRELQKYPLKEYDLRLLGHVHAHVCLLVGLGGKLRRTKKSSWTKWMQLCVEKGLSTRVFENKACPSWIDEKDAAESTAMALGYGSNMLNVDRGPAGDASPMHSGQQTPKNQGSIKKERGRIRQHLEKVGHRMRELFGQDSVVSKQ